MNRPGSELVSVIIPTYRRPREVRLAVESVLAQSWPEIEVVVVADGPDAETRAALQGVSPRLRYLELAENHGPAAARNAGVQASRGEWLSFLDDDDLMLPGKIKAQMQLADCSTPQRMISCRTVYRHGRRDDVWPRRPIASEEDLADYILRRPSLLGRPGVVLLQTLLLHRSLVERLPFRTHADHEDWAWLLEAWHLRGARVVFVWEPLVIYRIEAEAISRSRRANWEDSVSWAQQYRRWIGDRAFCSFLCTKAALKARRAGSWRGLWQILRLALRSRPGSMDLFWLGGMALLPSALLQRAWKRSLQASSSEKGSGADLTINAAPQL